MTGCLTFLSTNTLIVLFCELQTTRPVINFLSFITKISYLYLSFSPDDFSCRSVLTLAMLRFNSFSLAVLLVCCIDSCKRCEKNSLQEASNSFFNSITVFFLNSEACMLSSQLSSYKFNGKWQLSSSKSKCLPS